MKKTFTILIAALAAILLTTIPEKTFGQASVDDILWSETWNNATTASSASNSATPSANCSSDKGTFVYNNGTVTYSQSSNSVYVRTDATPTGGSGNNLIMPASSTWTISDIPTGQATAMTLTFASNRTTFSVTSTTSGITISGSGKSWTISQSTGITSFNLTITNSGSNNARVDNTELKVKTAGSITTHTFTTAVSPAGSGSVTAKDSGDNTVASGSEVGEEALLTVTATPNSGYKFASWSVVGEDSEVDNATDNPTTFMMGTEDATLTANFATAYAVNISNAIEHGSVVADMATAMAGEDVTLTATPAEGYDFTSFTVTKTSSGTVDVTTVGTEGVFTMPAEAVTVSATFMAKTTYEITTAVTPANSGTITAAANAWEGKTVNVSVSPAGGYVYSSIAIAKTSDGTASGITPSGNATDGFTFTMPAYAVTITATFATADIYAKYSGDLTEGDYVIYYNGYAMKNTVSSNRLTYSTVTPASNQIVNPKGEIVWHIAPSGDYWTIYNSAVRKYAAGTGADNKAQLLDSGSDDKSLWTVTGSSTFEFVNKYNKANNKNSNLRNNGTSGFACYSKSTGGALTLYKKTVYSTLAVANNVPNGTITATPAGGSAIAEDGSTTVSSGTTVTLSATGEGSYVLDAWNVYKTSDESTKVTVTSNTFTMPDYDVTVSASFRQPTTYTAQFSVNGEIVDALTQPNVAENSSITLPLSNNPNIVLPSGYVFAGWTDNPTTCAIISGSTYQMTSNMTFYLVFTKSGESLGYKKVEADLGGNWAGDYLIAYSSTVFADGRTGGTSGMGAQNSSVNPGGNLSDKTVALNWGDTYNITLEEISYGSNTYVLKTQDGRYNYQTSNSNGLASTETKETAAAYPITVNFDNEDEINLALGGNAEGAVFRYNSSGYFRFYKDGGQEAVYLYKKTQVYTRVSTISDGDEIATINPNDFVTVPNGATFTLTGSNNGTAANLIIEDGGQLICNNSVAATVKKSITASSASKGEGWYTISSPVNNKTAGGKNYETVAGVTNLVPATGKYDLYRFNETKDDSDEDNKRWENYKVHGYDLEMGRGYIYRKNSSDELSFVGNTNVGNITYTLTCSDVPELAGFNLIGNPYPHSIAKGSGKAIYHTNLATNYYVLSNDDTWALCTDGDEIPAKQGILVKAVNEIDLTISDTPYAPAAPGKYKNDNIRFSVKNEKFEDVAYAWFDKGYGLNKIAHRNPDAPMLYIPQDGTNYATAIMSDDIKVFGLSFKAMTMGKYTLRTKANGDYTYLHVIDRLTGEDVDMLLDGEYSFVASPNDKENRFIVKLEYKPDYSEGNSDIFAYQSGSEILVSGEGELQIFDVTGRNVMTTTINGAEAINGLSNGVYIFRLVGNDIKTQKIVVR